MGHTDVSPSQGMGMMQRISINQHIPDFSRVDPSDQEIESVLHRLAVAPWYADSGLSSTPEPGPDLLIDWRLEYLLERSSIKDRFRGQVDLEKVRIRKGRRWEHERLLKRFAA